MTARVHLLLSVALAALTGCYGGPSVPLPRWLGILLLAPWVGVAAVLSCADEIDGIRKDCPAQCLRSVTSEIGPLDCERFAQNERRAIAELIAAGVVDAGDACAPFLDVDYVVVNDVEGGQAEYVMGTIRVEPDDQGRAHEMIHHLERMRMLRLPDGGVPTEHEGWIEAKHWTTAARYEGQAYRLGNK